nr:hypothetical protein [Tanacetum cinerariifolium]
MGMKNSFIEGLLFEIQQQNVRQDSGASEAIQELRDAIDDVRGQNHRSIMQLNAMRLLVRVLARSSAIIRVANIVRRAFKRAFEQAALEIGWELGEYPSLVQIAFIVSSFIFCRSLWAFIS